MSDKYGIDSHKLHLHPRRVADWLEGKNIAPIYMEISPSGACNHRCRFCGLDFMGYKPRFLPTDLLCERLREMGEAGLKSVMYAGEGEPFLHKDMAKIARATKEAGIDVAFTTNAVNLKPNIAGQVLPVTSWIKVSCNAGSPETYAQVHGTQAGDFEKVMSNMAETVRLRKELGSDCALGFQMVLLPENQHEAVPLAKRVKALGADYLVIKPYSVHRQSGKDAYLTLSYDDCAPLAEALAQENTPDFKVIFRHEAIRRTKETAPYDRCLALPFWGYVDSGGNVWGCLRHIGEKEFSYGNLLDNTFHALLSSRRIPADFSVEDCHTDCRMDPINGYLWQLAHPGGHINFI